MAELQTSRGAGHCDWIVHKIGGTSIGKFPDQVIHNIANQEFATMNSVVVCSAISQDHKANGTTAKLLSVYECLHHLQRLGAIDLREELVKEACSLADAILADHMSLAKSLMKRDKLLRGLVDYYHSQRNEIQRHIADAESYRVRADSALKDQLVGIGEKLSSMLVTNLLKQTGIPATFVDLSQVCQVGTVPHLPDATFYKIAIDVIVRALMTYDNRVLVVTGCFGPVPGGLIDGDIGRGYTDVCAALCAVGLGAGQINIWKEVDGLFTADPLRYPSASLIPIIMASKALELSSQGAEVIHRLALHVVMQCSQRIQITIKNVCDPHGYGTVIIPG